MHKYAVNYMLLHIAGGKQGQTLLALIVVTLSLSVKQMLSFPRKDKLGRSCGSFHPFRESSNPTSAMYPFSTVIGKFDKHNTPFYIRELRNLTRKSLCVKLWIVLKSFHHKGSRWNRFVVPNNDILERAANRLILGLTRLDKTGEQYGNQNLFQKYHTSNTHFWN